MVGETTDDEETFQLINSIFFLAVLLFILVISIWMMYKKPDVVNTRGHNLLGLMIAMHIISLGYPNVLTLISLTSHHFKISDFIYFNLTIDNLATLIISNLILTRAIFMYNKANNGIMTNLRGVSLTSNLYFVSVYIFIVITARPLFPDSLYKIMSSKRNDITYIYPVDVKNFVVWLIYMISLGFVLKLLKLGARKEMISLLILQLIYMFVKGMLDAFGNPKYFKADELISNIHRSLLMLFNCFWFIWSCDDSKKFYGLAAQMDVYKTSHWEEIISSCFNKFLLSQQKQEESDFFQNRMRKNFEIYKIDTVANSKDLQTILIKSSYRLI